MPASRSNPLHAPDRPMAPAHPARLILILSLAPTVGLGIGRFAYSLVLPDMRDALVWSYSAAGFMNTINAAGYLAGALLASRLIRRFGLATTVRWGTLACVVSLALCAISGNFVVLSFARLLAGLGAAAGFVGGGALAATIAQSRPERANFLLSLFYAGPGIGILSSGLVAPFVLQAFGPGSWWIVWWAMTLLAAAMTVPLLLAPISTTAGLADAAATPFRVRPVLLYLAGYFLFGAGYIAYMTFVVAFLRAQGAGSGEIGLFWVVLGVAGVLTAFVWGPLLAGLPGALGPALVLSVVAVGAALPLASSATWASLGSAVLFGGAFLAVVTSFTTVARSRLAPELWSGAIATLTVAFALGQSAGPILAGFLSDGPSGVRTGLVLSVGLLVAACLVSLSERTAQKV
jgi:predicted MFS family arabinose efflux permease